jgi:branched-chain amino acid transport system ATP-binding protein
MRILEVEKINTYYGTSHILHDLSMHVEEHEVICLLGRNGAGKTTTIRSLMALTPPRSGEIKFRGKTIIGLKPYQIFRMGVKIVPQGRGIFPALTVEENLGLSMLMVKMEDPRAELNKIYQLFPALSERRRNLGSQLSGGELQMLAIARALLGQTELILMDEPTEGLAPILVDNIRETLLEIKKSATTIVLAEQNAKLALEIGDRHYIIDNGHIRFEGRSQEISENEEIKTTYLGVGKKELNDFSRTFTQK